MSFSSFDLLNHDTNILVFGKNGQVGKALQQCMRDLKVNAVLLGRSECDLSKLDQITAALNRYQPHIIINASAYTAVDKAESEPELANAINAIATQVMAHYVANVSKGVLVHFSTDYVFSGDKTLSYLESDATGPLGIYGKSKVEGERLIANEFEIADQSRHSKDSGSTCKEASNIKTQVSSRYFILRASWVYGEGINFIRTMLKLAAERDQLKVIADQYGVPTSADWLAQLAIEFAGSNLESGVYHAVPDGETTWHGLAVFAIETARQSGEGIEVKSENIQAIPATEFPLPAPRPSNSRMDNAKLKKALSQMAFTGEFPKWQDQVQAYVQDYVKSALKS